MVPITSLWVPILLSAVAVFVASSIIHMLLTYHRSDYRKLASEDDVMEALRKSSVTPGDYLLPYATSPKAMKDPAFREKMTKGPVGFLTVREGGPPSMGKPLILWFIYCVVVGSSRPTSRGGRCQRVLRSVPSCVSLVSPPSRASPWRSGRTPFGPDAPRRHAQVDVRRSRLCASDGRVFGWLWPH